jgi:hypothetical protein
MTKARAKPAAPEGTSYDYDVFISYSSKDKAWVRGALLKRIEKAGLHAFIDFRDFTRGAPSIKEMERGVVVCRKTLLVLTPDYIESGWAEIESIMLATLDPANRDLRTLPLLKKQCDSPGVSRRSLTSTSPTERTSISHGANSSPRSARSRSFLKSYSHHATNGIWLIPTACRRTSLVVWPNSPCSPIG